MPIALPILFIGLMILIYIYRKKIMEFYRKLFSKKEDFSSDFNKRRFTILS